MKIFLDQFFSEVDKVLGLNNKHNTVLIDTWS